MSRSLLLLAPFVLLVTFAITSRTRGVPGPNESLKVGTVIDIGKEVDGSLYVHTMHNGVYVFTLTDATTLGTLHTLYTKATLDALAEDTNPNWGFDVVDGGA